MAGQRGEQSDSASPIGDLRSVIEYAHEAFIEMDAGGFVVDWNAQAERTFGWSREEAVGRVLGDLIVPSRYRAAHLSGLRRFTESGESAMLDTRLELSAIDRAGHEFPIELTVTSQRGPASAPRFFAFLHDISERRLSARLLRAQHAIASVFAEAHSTHEAMVALLAGLGTAMDWQLGAWWAPSDDEQALRCQAVWRCDPALAPEFEQASLELVLERGAGLPGRVWVSGLAQWTGDLAADASIPRALAAGRAGLHASLCVPILSGREFRGAAEFFSAQTGEPDLATRRILATIAAQIGGFLTLLDERSELIGTLQRLALTDELTNLANRRAWQQSLERELAHARRQSQPLCVAMLDIDHFKAYNDAHGHQAGDRLLREIARIWCAQLRASDILARYGGEEFSLLLTTSPLEDAAVILERMRIATPEGQTCSAGLATFDGVESGEELVDRADAALYEAKERGRDCTVIARADRPRGGPRERKPC